VRGVRRDFFVGIAKLNQWMGNLFSRKQPIDIIKNLRFAELRYWNEWHELMNEEEKKQMEIAKGKK
jgi:hypothetical protein